MYLKCSAESGDDRVLGSEAMGGNAVEHRQEQPWPLL